MSGLPAVPTCAALNINGLTADLTVADRLIGVTAGTTTGEVSVPIYGNVGSGCTLSSTGYRSIISIIASTSRTRNTVTGQLSETDATSIMNAINICKPTTETRYDGSAANACANNDDVFITGVKREYDYYYKLYKHAITRLVTVLSIPLTGDIETKISGWKKNQHQTAIDVYKSAAIKLNESVNDLIYIIDHIAQIRRTQNIPFLTERVNTLDGSLQRQQDDLIKQRGLLSKKNQDQMLLMKEMEEYSRHKSKYNNNLLMLYSFLNITALGLLFYVYRS
jgi:hypothetical protein